MVDFLSNFILLFLTVLFLKSFYESYSNPQKHFTLAEYVTLQPIGEEDTPRVQQSNKKIKPIKPSRKVTEAIDEAENMLKADCKLALKKLGCDEKQSKYLITMTFKHYQPKTVEEFLQKAFI